MKRLACLLGLIGAIVASAQTPKLGDAKFVAPKANAVQWNREGDFLAFGYQAKGGRWESFGLFDCTKGSGATILTTTTTSNIENYEWLGGKPIMLVDYSESIEGRKRRSLIALDGRSMKSKSLWTAEFKADENVSISWECSPKLAHAIVTVTAGKVTRHVVVALGANDAVYASDIDKATAQGIDFAGWSIDGTALYGPAGSGSNVTVLGDLTSALVDFTARNAPEKPSTSSSSEATTKFAILLDASRIDGREMFNSRIYAMMKRRSPAYNVGETVWEVVPANGVMRQIRFQGYLPEPVHEKPRLALADQPDKLEFKASQGKTKALWLTPNAESPTEGVLISPQAEDSWLQPNEKSVVFTVNGVLFFRSITR